MAGRIEYDDWGRAVIVHETSAASEKAIVDAVRERANAGHIGSSDMRYLGEVTPFMLQKYCDKTGVTWDQAMQNPDHFRRILNDPENSYMRVWKGRV
ncbi:hypothetical protein [Pseudoxanthomonas sp. CF125]|uniref:hypothetical protein n=1 Tax=Pseudoxanthomonas sp. CF125 TaxID=1855303 RepID=UPI000885F545|nr:hypothetical protein [Pseudoxanthomonas sp. CF125]SDQ42147.1 hypothetical protein SAMN05216569_1062 [Pseudoxanthomonas sp. CF125]